MEPPVYSCASHWGGIAILQRFRNAAPHKPTRRESENQLPLRPSPKTWRFLPNSSGFQFENQTRGRLGRVRNYNFPSGSVIYNRRTNIRRNGHVGKPRKSGNRDRSPTGSPKYDERRIFLRIEDGGDRLVVGEDSMTGSVLRSLQLKALLVCCWENLVREVGLFLGLLNPNSKHINVGWRLGRDPNGGPISSLVSCLDGEVNRRTEIKRVPDVRVPQSSDTWIVGDVDNW